MINKDFNRKLNSNECEVVESKVDYFNILKGDLCFVLEDCGIFKKVVKVGVGMDQIHYLYNFETQLVKTDTPKYQQQRVLPLIMILATSETSISHNRMFNDILLELDGNELKHPDKFRTRPDLAPSSLLREMLKMLGGYDIEDDIIDGLLDGKLHNFIKRKFVHVFYTTQFGKLQTFQSNWQYYKPFVSEMRDHTKQLEQQFLSDVLEQDKQ